MERRAESPGVADSLKRKTKLSATSKDIDSKKVKLESDEPESAEDIARSYKRFQSADKYDLNSEELYCVCRKPDHGGELMISCDGCEEWFHAKCMKIDSKYTPLIEKFFCKFCQWRKNRMTVWSRKCRMPDCSKPVKRTEKSKYCSEECGLKFLESQLQSRDSTISKGEMKFVFDFCEDRDALLALGSQFPELPEVKELDFSVIPEAIKQKLTGFEEMHRKIKSEIQLTEKKTFNLLVTKDRTKIINEKVQQVQDPLKGTDSGVGKKKKSSSKKVDLCCFDPELDDLFFGEGDKKDSPKLLDNPDHPLNTYEVFKDEIDECVDSFREDAQYEGKLCLVDRRKCLRHNGWYNLLGDRLWKRQHELNTALTYYEQQRSKTLRDYSISVYEAAK